MFTCTKDGWKEELRPLLGQLRPLLETIDASDMTGGEPGFNFRQTLGGSTNQDGFNSSSTAAWYGLTA